MPVSLLNADTSFPSFTEGTSTSEKVDVMINYLYMLLEELRYTFGNLGTENFNDKSLDELAVTINKPVLVEIKDSTKGLLNKLQITAEGLEALTQSVTEDSEALTQFKTFVSNTYATIKSITNLKTEITEEVNGSVNTTISDALAAFELKVSENYASATMFASYKQEVNGTIDSFKNTVNQSLAEFEGSVNGSITSITETVSNFTANADKNYASATMFAEYKEEVNGTIDSFKDSVNGSITSITKTVANFTADADKNYASATMFASYKTEVSKTYATKDALANSISGLESTVTETLASFTADADKNYAKTEQIASITNSSGKVTAASIVAAVNSSGSSVKISADKVDISGFVTFSDLGDYGQATIAGNRISLQLDGAYDNGYVDLTSRNELQFIYITGSGAYRNMADIYTKIDGNDSDETSRYALCVDANAFYNTSGDWVHASLKLSAAGRMSLEAQYGIYIGTSTYGTYGSITIDADDVTCVRAKNNYRYAVADGKSVGYCFCADGIYYNGVMLIAT